MNNRLMLAVVGTSAAIVARACVEISKESSRKRNKRIQQNATEKIVDAYLSDPKQFRAVVNDALIDVKFWDIIADTQR